MRRAYDRIGFYAVVLVCNIMTWGMFQVLDMPRFDSVQATTFAVSPVKPGAPTPIVGKPVRIRVPDVGIDVNVADGSFDVDSQTWTISDGAAYFALASVPANDQKGTTLLYGHARPNMFEPLARASSSSIPYVYTDTAKVFTYRFASVREVVPTDTSVFTETGPPTLVMQTCSGPWDRYRALYSFSYVEVKSV